MIIHCNAVQYTTIIQNDNPRSTMMVYRCIIIPCRLYPYLLLADASVMSNLNPRSLSGP